MAGWSGAIIAIGASPKVAWDVIASLRESADEAPVLVIATEETIGRLGDHDASFDDFCVLPFHAGELEARIDRLFRNASSGTDDAASLIVYGPLMINPTTYQAMIDERPLDLTYMEYELLRYFAQHPGRVCTREVLLSQVWGYDYYGGARTVDVHVRRLRAKLGEPHAGLIGTVRSVGYRFGKSQWG